jgi:hypothetical protein
MLFVSTFLDLQDGATAYKNSVSFINEEYFSDDFF